MIETSKTFLGKTYRQNIKRIIGICYRYAQRGVIEGITTALVLRGKKAPDFYAQIPLSFTMQANQEDLIWESMLLFYQVLIKGTGNEHEAHGAYYEITKLLDWEEYKRTITEKDNFLTMDVWQILHK